LHNITPLKQAELQLKESLQRFQTVMDSFQAHVFVTDLETYEILFANKRTRKDFGEDALGKICWHFFQSGQDGPCETCNNHKLLDKDGNPADVIYRESHNPVTGRWYFVQDQAILWLDGRYVRLEVATDITERKMAEAKLQESEMRYQQMFESHPAIQWIVDPQTQILVAVNPAAEKYYGYSHEQMRNMPVSKLNVLSEDEIVHKMNQARLAERQYFEVPHRLASGEVRLVEIHAAPIEIGGRPLIYAILHDVTDRRMAEDGLRQSNQQLALLNQATEELNSTLDLDRVLETILNEIRHLLGAVASSIWLEDPETKELVCQQATEPQRQVVLGWRLAQNAGFVGWVVDNGRSLNIADAQTDSRHFRGVDQQTKLVTRSLLCVPLKLQQRVIGVLQVIDSQPANFSDTDLSLLENLAGTAAVAIENARLHQQLTDHAADLESRVEQRTQELVIANKQLKELARLKTKLIQDISHELRTPITNLSLYLDLLKVGNPAKREQYMAVIEDKVKQLTHLTEDVLDVFRLDMFKGDIVFQTLDLNEIVMAVAKKVQPRLDGLSLQFVMKLAPRPLPVLVEKKQIEQVVTNLLLNAINYTPDGSITIKTIYDSVQSEAHLLVQDTGLGIEVEDMPYIFDRFYRGQNLARFNLPGSGLGLSIAKDVVLLHNGRIEVKSEPGQGSTFQVGLPLVEEM
jgi:PAS domain S-box-containing protein